jgi:hypothetical protein
MNFNGFVIGREPGIRILGQATITSTTRPFFNFLAAGPNQQ